MDHQTPSGAADQFEALRPLVHQLRALQRHCRPFGADYHAMAVSIAAMDEAAEAITGQRNFYGSRTDAAGPIKSPSTSPPTA